MTAAAAAVVRALLVGCALLAPLAAAAPGFKPNASVNVNVWTNANEKWFTYPEQSPSSAYYLPTMAQRPNFGIAVSGGGYRAVTLALGYVRGLYMMDLVQQSRYLASNSGGSWFNAAFSYQSTIPVSEFMGPYVPPQNLTRDALRAAGKGEQGAFATTISNAVIKANALTGAVKDAVTGDDRGPGAWSDSIGNAFLAPYELNSDKSTFTANGTAKPIHTNLGAKYLGDGLKVYPWQGRSDPRMEGGVPRPFPIILGSLFNRVDNVSLYYPCEFTPEYIGVPPVIPNEQANKTIGGGFVDPIGFNSWAPIDPPKVPPALAQSLGKTPPGFNKPLPKSARGLLQAAAPPKAAAAPAPAAAGAAGAPTAAAAGAGGATTAVSPLNAQLPLPVALNTSFIVPLKVAAGISSSFLSQGLAPADSEALQELTGTEELQYWNQVNFQGMIQAFADGGGTDNLAVTPLLRRRVAFIVSCIAASEPLEKDTKMDDWALAQWDISALFGAVPTDHPKLGKKRQVNNMPPELFNRATQVFPKAGWAALFKGLQKAVVAGGPAAHLAEYTTVANPYQGVQGGLKVKVLWVANTQATAWEKQLPDELQKDLAASRHKKGGLDAGKNETKEDAKGSKSRAELKNYPYVSTFNADYSPILTGMLNQQATWSMLQLRPHLQKLLAGSGATVAAPTQKGRQTTNEDVGQPSKGYRSAAGGLPAASWLTRAAALVAAAALPLLAL